MGRKAMSLGHMDTPQVPQLWSHTKENQVQAQRWSSRIPWWLLGNQLKMCALATHVSNLVFRLEIQHVFVALTIWWQNGSLKKWKISLKWVCWCMIWETLNDFSLGHYLIWTCKIIPVRGNCPLFIDEGLAWRGEGSAREQAWIWK